MRYKRVLHNVHMLCIKVSPLLLQVSLLNALLTYSSCTSQPLEYTSRTLIQQHYQGSLRASSDCTDHRASLTTVTHNDGHMLLMFSTPTHRDAAQTMSMTCEVHLTSQPMFVISAVLLEHDLCGGGVYVLWNITRPRKWDVCSAWHVPGPDFTSTVDVADVRIVLSNVTERCSFNISFSAVEIPSDRELELRYISSTEGYIQTRGWTYFTEDGAAAMAFNVDSWVNVSIPLTHHVMATAIDVHITQPSLAGCGEWVELWVSKLTGGEGKTRMWRTCGEARPDTLLLRASEIHVYVYIEIGLVDYYGFRLLFTFLQSSEIPERLANNTTWNCTVPHWPRFRRHFRCNLREECINMEDEVHCPYSACRHAGVTIAHHCYFYLESQAAVSWNEAQQECRKAGTYLASLTSPREWSDVMSWLHLDNGWQDEWTNVYIGVASTPPGLPFMYRNMYLWEDGTAGYFLKYKERGHPPLCAGMMNVGTLVMWRCHRKNGKHFICEEDRSPQEVTGTQSLTFRQHGLQPHEPPDSPAHFTPIACPSGHWTHEFLARDAQCACWQPDKLRQICQSDKRKAVTSSCQPPLSTLFTCRNEVEHVPYSLVCDHSQDCLDSSDEDFCVHPPCSGSELFECTNKQCVAATATCDKTQECRDSSDEELCDLSEEHLNVRQTSFPPAAIHLDGLGNYNVRPPPSFSECPETHLPCRGHGFCLPIYIWCNGVYDCPNHEDEHHCENRACSGLYRCRSSTVCLHVTHVCDGWSQCPQLDDENFCNLTCPLGCMCTGFSLLCKFKASLSQHPKLRYLHASGSGLHLTHLGSNTMLIYLNLARCQLTTTGNVTFPNLRTVDLSFNRLTSLGVDTLNSFPKVTSLSLSGNPVIFQVDAEKTPIPTFPALLILDLSLTELREIDPSTLSIFPNMQELNLSHCNVHIVQGGGFPWLTSLQVVDVRGCPLVSIPKSIFLGLGSLRHVFADNYKICCRATLPVGFVGQCIAPSDEISSCDALLQSDLYRFSLALFAFLATVGNALSLVLRVFVLEGRQQFGYTVFVTHLCVSDFMMGAYLVIIGVADRIYLNTYLWEDTGWRNSVPCKVAGFLSLLSSEVSAAIICLVTVDRFLVIKFPFSHFHFKRRSAQLGCLVLWTIGTVLAAVPLLPVTSSWHFYSQTGICIPLPVTRQDFPGRDYAFALMIVFNFVLFLLIAVGQFVVYMAIRSQSMTQKDQSDRRSKDLAVARHLFIVVVSDFLCWFPIGLLGVLASRDIPISGEVNVGMAIFVLPLNSALNPFLYSLNTIKARRARAREQKLLRTLMAERAAVK